MVNEDITNEEWANTEQEIIDEVKAFARKASDHDKDFYERVRKDRAFEAGSQWGSSDKRNRGKDRAQMTVNLCNVFINAVVNPFNAKPFKFKAVSKWNDNQYHDYYLKRIASDGIPYPQMVQVNGTITEEVAKLNGALTSLQNDFSTNEANTQALHDAVTTGIGFTYATIEEVNGEKKIRYNHIEDQTMVIVDPNAKGIALEESERIAVVDFVDYELAKELYGEDVVNSNDPTTASLSNFGSCWEVPKDDVAVVTYFRKDGHNVEYFRLCGDHIVDYGVYEGLDYLPVFAFTGDRIWLDKVRTFSGIVRKVKSQQRTINYAQSQLIERLSKSPKGFFIGYEDSFEGNEKGYQNAEFSNNMVIKGKVWDATKKVQLPLPNYVSPAVNTEDLQSVINASINQMSVATGISPNGIVEQNLTDQKTATEVLLRTKSSQSNVSNYISHAKESIRIAGNVIAHICVMLYGLELPKGSYDIVVEEGCVSLTKMEEDREKLLALAQIVPESFKPLISQHIVKTLDIEGGAELSQMLYNMLPAELRGGLPSMQEFQAQQMQMQDLQAKLAQAQEQNKMLNDQLTQAQLRTQTDLIMEDKKFEHDVALKELDFAQNQQARAQEMALEAKKDTFKAEQELKKQGMQAVEKIVEKAVEPPKPPVPPSVGDLI